MKERGKATGAVRPWVMFTTLRKMEEDIVYKEVNKIGKSPGKAGKSRECQNTVAMGKGREWNNRFKRI